jgi:hypothetical protein
MTEHYTKNTEAVTAWCNKCNRPTMHQVSAGRRGHCLEHETPIKAKPAEPQRSGDLFER